MTKTAAIGDSLIADLVHAEVDRLFPSTSTGVNAMMRHGLLPFGKMLGPRLVIRSALAVGGRLEHVLPAAVAVECVQVGAMTHDDIIDDDALRRGKPAIHAAFGWKNAVIAGDSLFFAGVAAVARCFDAGVKAERVDRAIQGLARATLLIGAGAADELAMARRICPVDDYLAMIRKKSGSWLWMACHLGAVLGGGDESEIDMLGTYGSLLGTGYQIRDDLMAFDGADAGKPHQSDMRNGRPTLPVLIAHKRATAAQRSLIEGLLADAASPATELHAAMANLVEATDSLQGSYDLARRYASRARETLGGLASSQQGMLENLTEPGQLI
jgi:geranylgeranyl pyrophosphate synthase